MATPKGTAVGQGPWSRRLAGYSIGSLLMALGALTGMGVSLAIGREQPAPVETAAPPPLVPDAAMLPPADEYNAVGIHRRGSGNL